LKNIDLSLIDFIRLDDYQVIEIYFFDIDLVLLWFDEQ
jgi:hypothetical protein